MYEFPKSDFPLIIERGNIVISKKEKVSVGSAFYSAYVQQNPNIATNKLSEFNRIELNTKRVTFRK